MGRLLGVLVLAFLVGCNTLESVATKITDEQAKLAALPTFQITCSSGCNGLNVIYHDPNKRQQITQPTNGWDATIAVANSAKELVLGSAPYAAVGIVAVKAIKNAGHNSTTNNNTTTSSNTTNSTTSSTAETVNGDKVEGNKETTSTTGDTVTGDKITGDKVEGTKVNGNQDNSETVNSNNPNNSMTTTTNTTLP